MYDPQNPTRTNQPQPDDDQDITLPDFEERVRAKYGIPASLWKAVPAQESGGDINAKSKTGVRGKYQVTQAVARSYGKDRDDPFDQAYSAARYLREQYDALPHIKDEKERWLGAVGRYYGGPDAVGSGGELSTRSKDGVSNPAIHVDRVARGWAQLERQERGGLAIPGRGYAPDSAQGQLPLSGRKRAAPQTRGPVKPATPDPFDWRAPVVQSPGSTLQINPASYETPPDVVERSQRTQQASERYRALPWHRKIAEVINTGSLRGGEALGRVADVVMHAGLTPDPTIARNIINEGVPGRSILSEDQQADLAAREAAQDVDNPNLAPVGRGVISGAYQAPVMAHPLSAALAMAAQQNWRDEPGNSAARTAIGTAVPIAGGKLANALIKPATQAGAIGSGVVGGALGTAGAEATEEALLEGELHPERIAQSAVTGGALGGAMSAGHKPDPRIALAGKLRAEWEAMQRPEDMPMLEAVTEPSTASAPSALDAAFGIEAQPKQSAATAGRVERDARRQVATDTTVDRVLQAGTRRVDAMDAGKRSEAAEATANEAAELRRLAKLKTDPVEKQRLQRRAEELDELQRNLAGQAKEEAVAARKANLQSRLAEAQKQRAAEAEQTVLDAAERRAKLVEQGDYVGALQEMEAELTGLKTRQKVAQSVEEKSQIARSIAAAQQQKLDYRRSLRTQRREQAKVNQQQANAPTADIRQPGAPLLESVVNPSGGVERPAEAPVSFDRLAENQPTGRSEEGGVRLLPRIRQLGGINPAGMTGELVGAVEKKYPGLINRRSGLKPDDMLELLAIDEGYPVDRHNLNTLWSAIDQDAAGKAVYPEARSRTGEIHDAEAEYWAQREAEEGQANPTAPMPSAQLPTPPQIAREPVPTTRTLVAPSTESDPPVSTSTRAEIERRRWQHWVKNVSLDGDRESQIRYYFEALAPPEVKAELAERVLRERPDLSHIVREFVPDAQATATPLESAYRKLGTNDPQMVSDLLYESNRVYRRASTPEERANAAKARELTDSLTPEERQALAGVIPERNFHPVKEQDQPNYGRAVQDIAQTEAHPQELKNLDEVANFFDEMSRSDAELTPAEHEAARQQLQRAEELHGQAITPEQHKIALAKNTLLTSTKGEAVRWRQLYGKLNSEGLKPDEQTTFKQIGRQFGIPLRYADHLIAEGARRQSERQTAPPSVERLSDVRAEGTTGQRIDSPANASPLTAQSSARAEGQASSDERPSTGVAAESAQLAPGTRGGDQATRQGAANAQEDVTSQPAKVRHDNPTIHGREIIRETDDGRVIVPNEHNKTGISVVKPKEAKFSSTQVNLHGAVVGKIKALGERIPETDLAEDGRETEPHITVKYGLHGTDPAEVQSLLADEPPVRVKLGKTSIFQNDGFDVVKADVDSPDLHRLNKKISDALPHTDTHPDYKPHATIAYVKPGLGKKYAGDASLQGQEVTIDRVLFSGKDGRQVEIPLGGKTGAAPKVANPDAETILRVINDAGGELPRARLIRDTNLANSRLRPALDALKKEGRIVEADGKVRIVEEPKAGQIEERYSGVSPQAVKDLVNAVSQSEFGQAVKEMFGEGKRTYKDEGVIGAAKFAGREASQLVRSWQLSGDFLFGRQWARVSVQPRYWAQAGRDAIKSLTALRQGNYEHILEDMEKLPYKIGERSVGLKQLLKDAGVEFTAHSTEKQADLKKAREEGYESRLVASLPLLRNIEQTNAVAMDLRRLDLGKRWLDAMQRDKSLTTPEQKKQQVREIARAINILSGRGQKVMTKPVKNAEGKTIQPAREKRSLSNTILSVGQLLNSPKYLVSHIQLLNEGLNPFSRQITGVARREMLKDIVGWAGVTSSALYLAAASGAQVGLDPDKADFGKVKFGDYRYNLAGGMLPLLRQYWKAGALVASPDKEHATALRRSLVNFSRNKLSAIPSYGATAVAPMFEGKDMWTEASGEKTTPGKAALQRAFPISPKDFVEAYQEDQMKGVLMTLPNEIGLDQQRYKDNPHARPSRLVLQRQPGHVFPTLLRNAVSSSTASGPSSRPTRPALPPRPTRPALPPRPPLPMRAAPGRP